jgi:hypothetical protein
MSRLNNMAVPTLLTLLQRVVDEDVQRSAQVVAIQNTIMTAIGRIFGQHGIPDSIIVPTKQSKVWMMRLLEWLKDKVHDQRISCALVQHRQLLTWRRLWDQQRLLIATQEALKDAVCSGIIRLVYLIQGALMTWH